MEENQTIGRPKPKASQTVAYTGTAGTITGFSDSPDTLRIVSTTDCFIEIGPNPTAVANTGLYLVAYQPEYFKTDGSNVVKVSAVQVSAGGSIYVTPFY